MESNFKVFFSSAAHIDSGYVELGAYVSLGFARNAVLFDAMAVVVPGKTKWKVVDCTNEIPQEVYRVEIFIARPE